jgi:hypothetical protein
MQMLNLFLGYPTYALTVVLAALLVFSGLGALASSRVRRRRRALAGCFAGLAGLTAFYLLGLGPATNAMMGLPLPLRIAVAVAVLAPLGLCLGMFMPIGLGEITGRGGAPRVYVAWGWAVNGFASVVGSAGATVLAMILGFDWVLFLGACAYLVAVVAWAALTRGAAAPATAG